MLSTEGEVGGCSVFCLYGMNRYVRSSRDWCAAHVQTLGICRLDGVLMGIERVTQN